MLSVRIRCYHLWFHTVISRYRCYKYIKKVCAESVLICHFQVTDINGTRFTETSRHVLRTVHLSILVLRVRIAAGGLVRSSDTSTDTNYNPRKLLTSGCCRIHNVITGDLMSSLFKQRWIHPRHPILVTSTTSKKKVTSTTSNTGHIHDIQYRFHPQHPIHVISTTSNTVNIYDIQYWLYRLHPLHPI